jgi:hypothetical protein
MPGMRHLRAMVNIGYRRRGELLKAAADWREREREHDQGERQQLNNTRHGEERNADSPEGSSGGASTHRRL